MYVSALSVFGLYTVQPSSMSNTLKDVEGTTWGEHAVGIELSGLWDRVACPDRMGWTAPIDFWQPQPMAAWSLKGIGKTTSC